MENRIRELALFNLGLDSKLRGCDLAALKVRDICHGDQVAARALVMQHKTQRPVQFEITPATRDAVQKWIHHAGLKSDDFVFPSRIHDSPHLGTRQYARILEDLRAVQLLLGHSIDWNRRSGTLASRWTTHWKSRNRQRSDQGALRALRRTIRTLGGAREAGDPVAAWRPCVRGAQPSR